MPEQDDKNRDVATNKLLNILRTESDDTQEKGSSGSSTPSEQDDTRDFDSNELTRLFDQTVSGKSVDFTNADENKNSERENKAVLDPDANQKQAFESDSGHAQDRDRDQVQDQVQDNKEYPEYSADTKDDSPEENVFEIEYEDNSSDKPLTESSDTDEPEKEPVSAKQTLGPFVEFINRFETKHKSDDEDSSNTVNDSENVLPDKEIYADNDTESDDTIELLSFLDNKEDNSESDESEKGGLESEQETEAADSETDKKKSTKAKSFFDILDEYIATKSDDVVLPLNETDVFENFDKSELPEKEDDVAPESEAAAQKESKPEVEPVVPEDEKGPKSATQKVIFEDLEQEIIEQEEFLDSTEEEKIFEENFNSVTPAVKLKISEISDYINDKRNITVIESDEAGSNYIQAVPEVNKIKITNWGNINYWNFPKEATDEDKQKFALRSISRQIKHKKSFLTYFSHSRSYVTRIQTFQKLSSKETQEALKWAISKNLPFPDKKVEYDVKQISSDSVDEKNYLTLIAPQTLVLQQEKFFRDFGMNPRKISTVSALAAKAFRLNYPDYYKETAIIFYFGDTYSNLIFIKNHEFHYEREFGVGRKDLISSLNQEVNTINGPKKLSRNDAIQLLDSFGFTRKKSSSVQTLGIDYSRYSIMIRPLAERIIMEISRSIDFYKKNFSLLADGDIFLIGPGAVIPGVVRFIEDQLGRKTSVLNPMRTDIFTYKTREAQIPDKMLPLYTLHIAAAYPDSDLNVISAATRSREVFIAGSKLSRILLIIFIVFAGIRTNDMLILRDDVKDKHKSTQIRWQNVSNASSEFMIMNEKENTMTRILNQVREDQYSTDRTLSLMKLISNLTPAGVHLIDFQLGKSTNPGEKEQSDFVLKGYITRNPSVADIYLNNYLAKFRDTGFFQDVTLTTRDERIENEMRRTFTITGVLKQL